MSDKKSKSKAPKAPRVTDIVWEDRKDGRLNKVFMNGKKKVRVEVVDER